MNRWIPDLSRFSGPKYLAIADALTEAIDRGSLAPGDRLPPQRELADTLGFDLTTVTRAYEVARERGLTVGRGRAGSFVRDDRAAATSDPGQYDEAMNCPPLPAGKALSTAFGDAVRSCMVNHADSVFHYQRPGGASHVRDAGAQLLSRIGLATDADQTVVTAGGQNALHAVLATMAKPGDHIACGRFVYPGLKSLAQRMQLHLVPLAEMTGDALEQLCRETTIKALYVVPTNDNPTTETLSSETRQQIAEVAERHNVQIIEDDAYGLLASNPPQPIASLIPDRSWYIASVSKAISPSLRVAFVRSPGVAQSMQLAAEMHETAVMAPPINAAVVAHWLRNGTFDKLVQGTRSEGAWRRTTAETILGADIFAAHPEGYHLWLPLPDAQTASKLPVLMRNTGLGLVSSTGFAVGEPGDPSAIRVSLGGPIGRSALAAGLRTLDAFISSSERMSLDPFV
ncbi:PLP-dependent aminotransferase family protein [Parasphingorhabdus sp.]|uniref:aminotransferase-like domain-containing protein n=1 Tax=Parasphingorhabdus sp. TaxID=2709688 RepID=UPI003A94F0DB